MIINGKRFDLGSAARNVSVVNGKVIVDGKHIDLDGFADTPVFNITIEGNVDKVDGEFSTVKVIGNTGDVKTMSGDVRVEGDVVGSVSTMSGDAKIKGNVGGSVKSMSGDIKR